MKTKTVTSVFGKHPIIEIYEDPKKEDDKCVIQFGLKKAEAILASIDEIKKFVEENKK